MERLLEDLETVRRATVVRPSLKGRSRVSTQLEDVPNELKSLLATLGLSE
jgi:hypothetical protein